MTHAYQVAARPRDGFVDGDEWAFYLDAGERLLGTWRPDDTFRPYGAGKAIMAASAIGSMALLIATALFAGAERTSEAIQIAAAVLALGAILGFGPAKLDQVNRRARRYALSDRRALEFQDIRAGRLRSVIFGPKSRVLKLYNDGLESYELTFANLDDDGRVSRSVLFERLTENQVNDILRTLWREGVVERSGLKDGGRTGLRTHRARRTRL